MHRQPRCIFVASSMPICEICVLTSCVLRILRWLATTAVDPSGGFASAPTPYEPTWLDACECTYTKRQSFQLYHLNLSCKSCNLPSPYPKSFISKRFLFSMIPNVASLQALATILFIYISEEHNIVDNTSQHHDAGQV